MRTEEVTGNIATTQGLQGNLNADSNLKGNVTISTTTDVGANYKAGENIDITNNVISVITTDEVEADNTRPITSSAVYTEVGNINVLLQTI